MNHRIWLGIILACLIAAPNVRAQQPNGTDIRAAQEARRKERLKIELDMRAEALAKARQQLDQTYEELRKLQSQLRETTGRSDVSPEGLQKAASRLDEEMESMTLDEVGSKARADALAKTIAEQTDRAKVMAQGDDAAAELMAVVQVREKQLERMQQLYKTGAAPLGEVQQAEASLAEAKATVAERRRALVTGPAGDGVAVWNRELLNLTIAQKERQARMVYIEERLKRLSEAMPAVDQLQNLQEAVKAARAAVQGARAEFEQFRMFSVMSAERQEGGNTPLPPPPAPAKESQ
ncbi:MAG: hypothetical protein JWL69_248 [Phycisphaerales bacterium]|jgi:hypothetical protein|nr:hypothetical protein [Phycisphaerales bacterium]